METTTQGRTLALMPKSTMTTSPRSKLGIINFRRRPKFFPVVRDEAVHRRFRLALAFEEFDVVQNFPQHRFGLALDFFNQHFLRAHGFIIRQNLLLASCIAPIVHSKMNTGKECSSAECARLRSRLHCVTTRQVASTRQGVPVLRSRAATEGGRRAPQFDFRHRQASCASPCEIMPRAKASHCLRRISQGEPRAPLLPLRHSECAPPSSRLRLTSPAIVSTPNQSPPFYQRRRPKCAVRFSRCPLLRCPARSRPIPAGARLALEREFHIRRRESPWSSARPRTYSADDRVGRSKPPRKDALWPTCPNPQLPRRHAQSL